MDVYTGTLFVDVDVLGILGLSEPIFVKSPDPPSIASSRHILMSASNDFIEVVHSQEIKHELACQHIHPSSMSALHENTERVARVSRLSRIGLQFGGG